MAAHACSGVRSRDERLLGAGDEVSQKWSRTLARGV